tara:strand:- start:54216 stop:55664 length:1449 start_codon:yes stop_codon:yes gene_type:complete
MKNYLDIRKLTISIDEKKIIDDADLLVARPCKIAIIGKSGSGKSLLAYAILGFENEYNAEKQYKNLTLNGLSISKPKNISYIPQEPLSSLNPTLNILNHFRINNKKNSTKINLREKIDSLLNEVGFENQEEILFKYPHELSGGMAQRILIALSLQNDPDLIIADEATSSLDNLNEKKILNLLRVICDSRNIGIILITHDYRIAKEFCDCIFKIENKIINQIPKDSIIDNINNENFKIFDVKEEIISMSKVSYFIDDNKILDDINLLIKKNESVGLLGSSGSGKSTIAKLITKYHSGFTGSVKAFDKNIEDYTYVEYSAKVQHVYQDLLGSLNPRKKIKNILLDLNKLINIEQKEFKDLINYYFKKLNLDYEILQNTPLEISGGQRQRVLIIKSLLWSPSLIVLDEPVSSLDPEIQYEIIDIINTLKNDKNLTFLAISHDIKFIEKVCDRIYILKEGQIIENGPLGEILNNPQHEYTKELISS